MEVSSPADAAPPADVAVLEARAHIAEIRHAKGLDVGKGIELGANASDLTSALEVYVISQLPVPHLWSITSRLALVDVRVLMASLQTLKTIVHAANPLPSRICAKCGRQYLRR